MYIIIYCLYVKLLTSPAAPVTKTGQFYDMEFTDVCTWTRRGIFGSCVFECNRNAIAYPIGIVTMLFGRVFSPCCFSHSHIHQRMWYSTLAKEEVFVVITIDRLLKSTQLDLLEIYSIAF
jgi:hypothetical protein